MVVESIKSTHIFFMLIFLYIPFLMLCYRLIEMNIKNRDPDKINLELRVYVNIAIVMPIYIFCSKVLPMMNL